MNFLKKIILVNLFSLLIMSSMSAQDTNKFDANGKRHGVWKKFYNNGRVRYTGQFQNGKEVGTFKYYSAAASEFPVVIKKYNKNSNIADVTFYTKKGIIESRGKMIGKDRDGKWLYFHTDGKTIMSEENYLNGKLNGLYKTFYKDGKPTEVGNYKNGKLDGDYKKYAIKGHLYQDLMYIDGKLNGEAKYFSRKTGDLVTKGQFKNDIRVGTWENYVDGELVSKEQPNKKKPKRKIIPKKKKQD